MQPCKRAGAFTALLSLMLGAPAFPAANANSTAMSYLLNCQGCHEADGSGHPGYVPDFRRSVARFVGSEEGRGYLARVPGVSQSFLSDPERAAVLNWILAKFDPEHLPQNFKPYDAAEMADYRRNPISQPTAERDRLLRRMASATATVAQNAASSAPTRAEDSSGPSGSLAAVTTPPPQFALCGACHPTSADGASAIGPNLRNVVGRRAGTLAGFSFSKAMASSGIVWTREALDAFLTDVQQKVPGTLMTLPGIPDSDDRAAVIAYLESLH